MHHSTERSGASAPSHHDLFLAAFIINIAEFASDEVLGTHKGQGKHRG
jgi:hypothetical protein